MKKAFRIILYIIIAVMIVNFGIYFITNKHYSVSDEWKAMVKKNYQEFISETENNSNRIPVIIHTDQHGAVSSDSEIYTYINSLVDWDKISTIINLGDSVKLVFNPLDLMHYQKGTQCLPTEKRIEVIGNHDRFFVPTGKLIEKQYFPNPMAMYSDDRKAFVFEDEKFNVRYLAVDTKCFPYYYTNGRLWTKQADFIIDALSNTDDSDVVLLSHAYLFKDEMIARDGSTFTGSEYFIGSKDKGADVKQSFIDMLTARKNKGSGTLIDSFGVEHPYDFSNCKGDFLLSLHGHHHSEGYETKDGITEFLFQGMISDNKDNDEPLCFYFAYIDTVENTLKVWKNVDGYKSFEVKF